MPIVLCIYIKVFFNKTFFVGLIKLSKSKINLTKTT